MASGPITSWQIDGGTMETVTDFIFLGPKSLQIVTAATKLKETCSTTNKKNNNKKKKRHLLLGRKAMTNLESMLNSGDISLPTKSV